MSISILIAEDDAYLRCLLADILAAQDGLEVVGDVGEGQAVLSMVAELKPQLVLLDLHLPGLSGLQVLERLAEMAPSPLVLVLSGDEADDTQLQVARGGARGFVPKSRAVFVLADAIRKVADGGVWFSQPVIDFILSDYPVLARRVRRQESPLDRLSPRELQVLVCVARGMTNPEIGRELHASVSTVKVQLGRVLQKLDLSNRTEAAVFATNEGLLTESQLNRPGEAE